MTISITNDHNKAIQTARLRQALGWLIPMAFGSALLYGAMSAIFALPMVALLAVIMVIESLIMAWLRWLIGHISLEIIALLLTTNIIIAILCIGILLPILFGPLAVALIMSITLALPYLESRRLLWVSLLAWLAGLLLAVFSRYLVLFDPLPLQASNILVIFGTGLAAGASLLLLWQYHRRLTDALAQTQAANTVLQDVQAGLELQIGQRTGALQDVLREVEARAATQEQLLVENQRQREVIRQLSVPVLPIDATTLVMPLVGTLDSARLQTVQQQALHSIERQRARRLLLDITGVPIVDDEVAQGLMGVVQAARLLGAQVALVGIRPEVAQAIVGLGVHLGDIMTFSDLQSGLRDGVAF